MAATKQFAFKRSEFNALRKIVYDRTGIALKDNKFDMVYSRLAKRLRSLGLTSFSDYLALLRSKEGESEIAAFVNAITTNLTRFFREKHHFAHLRHNIIKPIVEEARGGSSERKFTVWSAGCSSGMEPYTIAMTVLASFPQNERWKVSVLATDIDTNMLDVGKRGIYPRGDLEGIPAPLAKKFVLDKPAQNQIEMKADLKNIITFNYLNLMERWPMQEQFDAIFCRNVMIYFDRETQNKLVDRYIKLLRPGGALYLGHAESLAGDHPQLESAGKSSFIKALDA